jgi:hypothetical protein
MQRLFFLLFLIPIISHAQNLVPNPSFESFECTPWSLTWFPGTHWFNPNSASPDLWSTEYLPDCGVRYIYDSDFLNVGEWQWPHSGERYLGLYHIQESSCTREYVEVHLLEGLVEGYTYCVEFYVSLANRSKFCTDCLGVSFTTDSLVNFETGCELNVPFAVRSNTESTICDTLNWTLVSGEYTAQGGEEFIIIGNVLSNDSCILQPTIGSDPTWSNAGYYFIDDVSVVLCDTPKAVLNISIANAIEIYPNPCTTNATISSSTQLDLIEIFSTDGHKIYVIRQPDKELTLDTSTLSSGVYLVKAWRNSVSYQVLLIKQ